LGDRIFEAVSSAYDGDLQMLDSSSIRVHQHAASVKKGARKKRMLPLGGNAHTRSMGRSRGGLTTKIHALVDANGLPVLLNSYSQISLPPLVKEALVGSS
jgi:hypothetical protein